MMNLSYSSSLFIVQCRLWFDQKKNLERVNIRFELDHELKGILLTHDTCKLMYCHFNNIRLFYYILICK